MQRRPLMTTFRVGVLALLVLFSASLRAATDLKLSASEQRWINTHAPVITFSGDPNWLPFEAFDEQGHYIGIVAAFLQKFAEDVGIRIIYRPTHSWEDTLKLAANREVDVLSDVLGSLTLHDTHTFTDSYLSNNLVLISNTVGGQINDVTDVGNAKIAIIKGYGYTWELYQRYPNTHFIEVDNVQQGLAGLENKRFNFLITSYALGQFQIAKQGKDHLLHLRGQLPVQTHLAFAIRNDWPELRHIFNRWIETLTPEERYQIAENWYLANTRYFSTETVDWRYVIWLSLVITLLLGAMAYAWHSRSAFKVQKQRFETALAAINAIEWKMPRQSAKLELAEDFHTIIPEPLPCPNNLGELLELIQPQDQEQVYEAFRKARTSTNAPIDVEFQLNTSTPCWLALKGNTVNALGKRPTLVGTLENITASKQNEEQKLQNEALITILFDSIPDLVILELFGQDAPITNKAYRRYLDSQPIYNSLPKEQKGVWSKQEETLRQHKHTCHLSTWLTPKDQPKAYFNIIRIPFLDARHQVMGILSVARNITDTFLLQQELQQAKHQADQANASKTVFLANMSHEIRTPLNAILGYAQLLTQDDQLESESSRQIQRIYSAGQRLLHLINDILDLSKIEAGQIQLNLEQTPLKQELQELLGVHRQRAQAKGLALIEDIRLKPQDSAPIDRTKFGQILLNALDNAIKFTTQGSVTVSVEHRHGQLKITISDTGSGISQQELKNLFQPFNQGKSGAKHGGTGLGLVLARRLADAMGGSFSINSIEGQGTQALIEIPLILTESKAHTTPELIYQLPNQISKTALVIDDDELSRDLLSHMLKRIGFHTLSATDGQQALTLLEQPVDIIFSDIRMPNMDGPALLQHIRTNKSTESLPVIAVTASSFAHEQHHYRQNGFTDVIAKPIEWQQLYHILESLFPSSNEAEDPTPIEQIGLAQSNISSKINETEKRQIIEQFQQACQLGDADMAWEALNKLQEWPLSSDKLGILKSSLEQYDFEMALSVDL